MHNLNASVNVVTKAMDLQDEAQIMELFDQIKSEHGKADVLINNAGCYKGGPIGATPISGIWMDFVSLPHFQAWKALYLYNTGSDGKRDPDDDPALPQAPRR